MQSRELLLLRDYDMISQWWDAWNWPIIPQAILPEEGIIIESDSGEPLAAGFLYLTNSKVSIAEWIVVNPKVDKKVRHEALDLLIDNLCTLSQVHEKSHVFTFFEAKSFGGLIKRFESKGFTKADQGMTHLVRIV